MRSSTLRTAALAVALCATAFGASGARDPDVKYPAGASPSAMLIGTPPAPPTGDPPGTTPVSSDTTQVGKAEETRAKPQEGDGDSHFTLASKTPQKAGSVDPRPAPSPPEGNENKADPTRKTQ
jgi:hypothetical protein